MMVIVMMIGPDRLAAHHLLSVSEYNKCHHHQVSQVQIPYIKIIFLLPLCPSNITLKMMIMEIILVKRMQLVIMVMMIIMIIMIIMVMMPWGAWSKISLMALPAAMQRNDEDLCGAGLYIHGSPEPS